MRRIRAFALLARITDDDPFRGGVDVERAHPKICALRSGAQATRFSQGKSTDRPTARRKQENTGGVVQR